MGSEQSSFTVPLATETGHFLGERVPYCIVLLDDSSEALARVPGVVNRYFTAAETQDVTRNARRWISSTHPRSHGE